jgi:hypothetical protein
MATVALKCQSRHKKEDFFFTKVQQGSANNKMESQVASKLEQ